MVVVAAVVVRPSRDVSVFSRRSVPSAREKRQVVVSLRQPPQALVSVLEGRPGAGAPLAAAGTGRPRVRGAWQSRHRPATATPARPACRRAGARRRGRPCLGWRRPAAIHRPSRFREHRAFPSPRGSSRSRASRCRSARAAHRGRARRAPPLPGTAAGYRRRPARPRRARTCRAPALAALRRHPKRRAGPAFAASAADRRRRARPRPGPGSTPRHRAACCAAPRPMMADRLAPA